MSDVLAPDALLWGRTSEPGRHAALFVGGYAALILAGLLVMFVGSRLYPASGGGTGSIYEGLFAVIVLYSPLVAAVASTLRGGGLLAVLAIGVTPAVLFGAFGTATTILDVGPTGDSPAWALALLFAVAGLVAALAGFALAVVGLVAVEYVRGNG